MKREVWGGWEGWKRMNESKIGGGVLAIGGENKRGDTLMSVGVTPPEVHANNVAGPDR